MKLKPRIRILLGLLFSSFLVLLLSLTHKHYYESPLDGTYLLTSGHNDASITIEDQPILKRTLPSNEENVVKSPPAISDRWISIDKDIHIFSAYWESRIKPTFVRIIGIGLRFEQESSHINCALRYTHKKIIVTTAKVVEIPENHDLHYTAVFYFCHADDAPLQVALFTTSQRELRWLTVRKIEPNIMSRKKLALCIQPLYGVFPNNNIQIAEFISYYQLLNATHFVFYDYNADTSVISLLAELSKSGISIELLKWKLPDPVKDIWNFGQLASFADCVYRQTHSHEYVFIVDVDEFLVPHSNVSLQDLVEGQDNNAEWCSYMFRQSFFCLQLPDDPSSVSTNIKLLTLRKVLRAKRIWREFMRTKSILRSICSETPGIHYIWSAVQSDKSIMAVNPDVALLHHYRGGISDEECNDNVRDNSAVKFGSLILNSEPIKVWERWNKSMYHR